MTTEHHQFEHRSATGYGPPGGPPPGGGYGPPGAGGPPGYGLPGGGSGGGYGPPGPGGYGPPGGGGFGPPGYGPPPGMAGPGGQPPFSPLAIVSLVAGILSMPTCFCSCFAPGINSPLAIVAVVCGIVALNKIRAAPQSWRGSEMAIAGIVTGGLGLLLVVLAAFTTLDEIVRSRSGL